ncbi:bifunctional WD repeat-containing protein WDR18-Ipi3-RID3/WD40-repeat-containing domain superfamily/WD40-YVTN repeat-like-containing domain superfamily [Babesia duncani]|nr:bifunctional WD repeat-containing protein WDR18-Ipi3-RID3/WD40-repeat-containing domain superfamily/WD40-YVTN repeat-like-containing domain superfamily [Babesia duncani]
MSTVKGSLNDDQIIALGGFGAAIFDKNCKIDKELYKESINCDTNATAISQSEIVFASPNKAKLVFIRDTQSNTVSVPEVITSVTYSKFGDLLFCGSKTGKIYIWQMSTGALLKCFQPFFREITAIKINFMYTSILCASACGGLCLLDLVKLFMGDEEGTKYLGHASEVRGIVNLMEGAHRNSLSFVSISQDKNVRLWHHANTSSIKSFYLNYEPTSMEMNHCDDLILVPCHDGHIAVLNLEDIDSIFYLSGHT